MPMNHDRLFKSRYVLPKWGEIALSSLLIALISGILIIPGFQSAAAPFKSLSMLVSSSRFGHFLHGCHAYAGDLFLLAMLMHVTEYVLKRFYRNYSWQSWLGLMVLLVSGMLAVFSGFLSLGNLESMDAVQILHHILYVSGAAGQALYRFLLLSSQNHSVLTVLMHHAATFTVLSVMLTYWHLKRFKADTYAFYYTFVLLALLSALVPAGIGTHPQAQLAVVKGPWYFRGLQEMLSWLPVWLAGIGFPLAMIGLLSILPLWPQKESWILKALGGMLLFYIIETIIATFFRGAGWQLIV